MYPRREAVYYRRESDGGQCLILEEGVEKHNFNRPAARIFECCDGDKSVEDILSILSSEYKTQKKILEKDIRSTLTYFKKIGIIDFFKSKKPLKISLYDKYPSNWKDYSKFPRTLDLFITNRCNLNCKHCALDSKNNGSEALSTKDWKNVLDMAYDCNVCTIDLVGGEPLLRDDLYDLAEYANNLGFFVGLGTNGTLINNEGAKRISKKFDSVQISLDSSTPEKHDRFRRSQGCWKKTIEGIKLLEDKDILVNIFSMILPSVGLDEIERRINLANSLNINTLKFGSVVSTGRAEEKFVLSVKKRKKLASFISKKSEDNDSSLTITHPFSFSPKEVKSQLQEGCDKDDYLNVFAEGDVCVCPYLSHHEELVAGNVKEKPLNQILKSPKIRNFAKHVKSFGGCPQARSILEN